MTTATIEAPVDARRTPGQRSTNARTTTPTSSLADARIHAETAVTEIASSLGHTARTFVPTAVLRPSETVNQAFDLAEQCLAITRRICVEFALVVEGGIEGLERRAA
jgi:hypothetical protein